MPKPYTPTLDWIADEVSKAESQDRPLRCIRVDQTLGSAHVTQSEIVIGSGTFDLLCLEASGVASRYGETVKGSWTSVFGLPIVHGESNA